LLTSSAAAAAVAAPAAAAAAAAAAAELPLATRQQGRCLVQERTAMVDVLPLITYKHTTVTSTEAPIVLTT
jgi:hypothetical protein